MLEPITAVIAGTIVPIVDVAWSLWLVALGIAVAPLTRRWLDAVERRVRPRAAGRCYGALISRTLPFV